MFEPSERIACISTSDEMFSIVCEGSVVYQFAYSNRFKEEKKLDFFLDKKINHVSSTCRFIFISSLYNENKEDDKIYKMIGNDIEQLKIDEIVGKQRIMDVYSGGESAYILLGFIFYFILCFILIFYLFFNILIFIYYFLIFIFFKKIMENWFLLEAMEMGLWGERHKENMISLMIETWKMKR